ncbi:DNA-3-methyladenine glycosylase [Leucobacter musarum]|uniref:DNA-3-methyladenine glycosylase n=1 Tax=Leucobacter musarum TaxID=1930747 RepID=UPI0006A7CBD2|nr:DNA-3-methyladenine glycosylase [Leucobacter musarum]
MTPDDFSRPALEVAPMLLGALLTVDAPEGAVSLRVTEVEAYHGVGSPGPPDLGSHARNGKTDRNASMFGPPGHAYVYFSYGMHFAINVVCSPEGTASGVLLRAGEVRAGADLARRRRSARRPESTLQPQQLAQGPGNVAQALGIRREVHDGHSLFAAPFSLVLPESLAPRIAHGPRVGVAGAAGGPEFPWRFWIPDDPTVSAFRAGRGAPRPEVVGHPFDPQTRWPFA